MASKVILCPIVLGLTLCLVRGCAIANHVRDADLETTSIVEEQTSEDVTTESEAQHIYDGTEAYEYIEVAGGIALTKFNTSVAVGSSKIQIIPNENSAETIFFEKVIIPTEIDGKKVVGIGNKYEVNLGYSMNGCREIELPDSLEYIGPLAFFYTEGLERVSGGRNVKEIYGEAFSNCISLVDVPCFRTAQWVADDAFKNTPMASAVNIYLNEKDNVNLGLVLDESYDDTKHIISGNTYYGPFGVFEDETSVIVTSFFNEGATYSKIMIPDKINGKPVVGLGNMDDSRMMFTMTKFVGDAEIVLPDSVTFIGKEAFWNSRVKTISGGKGVEEIGDSAFKLCLNLESVPFLKTAKKIADNAFDGCSKLKR